MFNFLLGLAAFLVAGSAAYFSVLGIATLFIGSYYQVIVMAGALEFGKLVATSYLYRYWNKTTWWLKTYLIIAVLTLMGVTSLGIFGYLSAAYQVNSAKFSQIDQQINIIQTQQQTLNAEIDQNLKRIEMLNQVRVTQELRVQEAGNYKLPREQAYQAIDKANEEIQTLTTRNQELQTQKINKDTEIVEFNKQISEVKDIGTFKFVAQAINLPLDKVVIIFICLLICVFDPLAVSLVLAFNVATFGKILKPTTEPKTDLNLLDTTISTSSTSLPSTKLEEEATPLAMKVFHGKVK